MKSWSQSPGWIPRIASGVFGIGIWMVALAEDVPQTVKPNLLLIVSDDAGYADFGFQGSKDFKTPNLDRLAAGGVRFTQGYAPGCVCSPSRAGLLSGKTPARIGHEDNLSDRNQGVDTGTELLPARLKAQGYQTGALGKWHLGWKEAYLPWKRGFDEFYGFLGGGSEYFPKPGKSISMTRNGEPAGESTYMTTALGREASDFITRHKSKPWFLYLSFNAVHSPMQADPNQGAALDYSLLPKRRTLESMTRSLDDAVGSVLATLEATGQTQNTLVVFLNDNGGATYGSFHNTPLRGHKGTLFEGGIRVPFLMRWPGKLQEGRVYDSPVTGLDLLPTFLAASGAAEERWKDSDGVNLLPYLKGQKTEHPHQRLFWRFNVVASVREGDWKLIRIEGHEPLLFDLSADPAEKKNLAAEQPEKVRSLLESLAIWEKPFPQPKWREGEHWRKVHIEDHLKPAVYLGASTRSDQTQDSETE